MRVGDDRGKVRKRLFLIFAVDSLSNKSIHKNDAKQTLAAILGISNLIYIWLPVPFNKLQF